MDQKVLDFIRNHRVCSLTVLLSDGTPHAAAMHYSHTEEPLIFYFSTDKTYRKSEALLTGQRVKASMVIGFNEEEWLTLQLEGAIHIMQDEDETKRIKTIHYQKNPSSKQFESLPTTIFLVFTPTWWRFTDFNTEPPSIISP